MDSMEQLQEMYDESELDSEWNKYLASLNKAEDSKKSREKKRLEKRERETMTNLKNHVRGLSVVRFELENDIMDSLDDSISDSDSDNSSSDTVHIVDTPSTLDDDLDDFDDTDTDNNTTTTTSTTITSSSSSAPTKQSSKPSIKPIETELDSCANKEDIEDSQDSDEDSDSDEDEEDSDSNPMADGVNTTQYDEELEKLKQELKQFKRKNHSRLRRTKSQEEVLLSVLNIDQKNLDSKELKKYTKEAINAYKTIQATAKRKVEKKHRKTNSIFEAATSPIIMTPIPESPMPETPQPRSPMKQNKKRIKIMKTTKTKLKLKPAAISIGHNLSARSRKQNYHKNSRRLRRLADPYEEEWNGLDPDDYVWYDNAPEGSCDDDNELSVRNRRMQYLVVMAIENNFCSILDLTYKQNELLLLYQQQLRF